MEEKREEGLTIYINQRAYEWYILWRCCYYEIGCVYPHLTCPIEHIYATYYRLARLFDLVVHPIHPENMLGFLAPYRIDQTLSVVMKEPADGSKILVPCCVMSTKWALWYRSILIQSMQRGCVNMALRHVDGGIIPQGKTMRQLAKRNFALAPTSSLLGSKRMKGRDEKREKPSNFEPFTISSIVKQEDTKSIMGGEIPPSPVVYDKEHDEDSEVEEYSLESVREHEEVDETRVSIPAPPGHLPRASPVDSEREKVYEYIRKLRSGTPGPSLGASHSRAGNIEGIQASGEKLCEEYLSQREAMEESFSEERKKLEKQRKRKRQGEQRLGFTPRIQNSNTTVIVSKFIASIHQQLEESAIVSRLKETLEDAPEIRDYILDPLDAGSGKKSSTKTKEKHDEGSSGDGKGKKSKRKKGKKKKKQ